MRQSAQKAENPPLWKQEVNRRVAAHNGRKIATADQPKAQSEHSTAAGTRAARAAARVAARYAKAPSYSEMLAEEARAAVRAAEAVSRAALEAQAVAESVLADLEAAQPEQHTWEPEFFADAGQEQPWSAPVEPMQAVPPLLPVRAASKSAPVKAPTAPDRSYDDRSFEIRWDEDMPVRETSPAPRRTSHRQAAPESHSESLWDRSGVEVSPESEGFAVVEPAQPIHANLIEFPRELVATRKLRPRRAEGPYAASVEASGQLSIFEVEPQSVSTEAAPNSAEAEAEMASWVAPEWSGIELDEEPQEEMVSPAVQTAASAQPEPARAARPLQLASINRRMLAAVVDFCLIAAAGLVAALVALSSTDALPTLRQLEIGPPVVLAFVGLLYMTFFFTLGRATPGMKYANLELRTVAGEKPARAEMLLRVGALLLSLAPLGLGAVWAIFDEQHLCWHDRLSGTYPRRRQPGLRAES